LASIDRQRERFRTDPGDGRSFEALEEHYFLAGEWEQLIALYQRRLLAPDVKEHARRRAEVLFRLGQVWEERIGQVDRAMVCYQETLRADPSYRPALGQLRRLHAARGQWEVALQIAELETALPLRGDERADLLAEIAHIWLDPLGDPAQALVWFRRALAEWEDCPRALEGAARAFEAAGQPRKAARAWERRIAQLRGEPRADALLALARLEEGPLGEPEAAALLAQRALEDAPRHPVALEAVAREATRRGHWKLLAGLAERRFELTAAPAQRLEIALEAGRLELEELGNAVAARAWLERAREIAPEEPLVLEALADHHRAQGEEEALLACLERLLAQRADAPPIAALLEAATLHSERGADERSLACLERARARAPDDALVLEALADGLARARRWDELARVLERRAALLDGDPGSQAAVLAELGRVELEELRDSAAARSAFQRAFQADPAAPGVATALEQLYLEARAHEELRALYRAAGSAGPEEERAGFLCSLGEFEAEWLGEPAAAERSFEAALALDPEIPAAHRGLQALAARSQDEDALLHAYRREAESSADRGRLAFLVGELALRLERRGELEEALAWSERWALAAPDDVRALSERARFAQALGREEELLASLDRLDGLLQGPELGTNRRRLGALHAAAGRDEDAIRAFEAALALDPRDAQALRELVPCLERRGRAHELVGARRRLADLLAPPERARCLDALARDLEERLGDVAGAIEVLERLGAEPGAPADTDERRGALLERAGRFEELARQLEGRARALPEGDPRARELDLRRAALLLGPLARFDEAAEVYGAVRSGDPQSREARLGLERAIRAGGRPEQLAAFLAGEMRSEPDPARRERLAFERALLLEQELGDATGALEIQRELALAARDPELRRAAVQRLEALLERAGAFQALREHLERELGAAGEDAAAALHDRLGALCRDRLADPIAAIAHLEAAAEGAPARPERWAALAELYAETGRSAELVRALEAELETGPGPEREIALRARAAETCASALLDPERARRHAERVLELDPRHSGVAGFLIQHWERSGQPSAVVRLLEDRLRALRPERGERDAARSAERTSLRLRIAGLRAGSLEDLDGAIAVLEAALEETGTTPAVAEPLADLYQRAGYPEDLIELCRRAGEGCAEPSERAGWSLRMGDALRERKQEAEAAEAYRRALDDRPDCGEAQSALREIYRSLREHGALARLLEQQLARATGPEEVAARLELAGLLAGPLDRAADALPELRRVLELAPGHAAALEQALFLADRLGRHEELLELLDQALGRPLPRSARSELLARRAKLLAERLERPGPACASYREALALDPARRDLRRALGRILVQRGEIEEALDCLYREAFGASGEERAALFEQAAELAGAHLAPDASLPWLERLRRERPRDAAVVARIGEVHRAAGRREACLRALEEESELVAGTPRWRELQRERARLLEQELGCPSRAALVLEPLRRAEPADAAVRRELARLYAGLGRTRERLEVLEELALLGGEPDPGALLAEAASLAGDALGEPARAARHWLCAVAAAPEGSVRRVELLRALGRSLREAGWLDAWARCAEAELAGLDPEAPVFLDRRRELQRELARAYEGALARPDEALRHRRALLDGAAPAELAGPALDAEEQALLRGLRAQSRVVELEVRLAARLARRPRDPEGWLELGRLREERLRALPGAAEAYRRVLQEEPNCLPALRGLRGVAERLGRFDEVAETLERECLHPQLGAPAERSALLEQLGHVYWQRLQSTTRASRCYAAALEANPQNFGALRALEGLLEAMEDWRGALELCESEVEVLGEAEPERRRELWLRVADLARERIGDRERARRACEQAALLGPLPAARRAELAELHRQCGDLEAYCSVLADWCDDPQAEASGADHVRLAEALLELGRADAGEARVERALAAHPACAAAWDLAARLREQRGEVPGAWEALARAAQLVPDPEAAERLLGASRLAAPRDPGHAAQLLREAARRDPAAAPVQAALSRLALELGQLEEAVAAARRALDLLGRGSPRTPERRAARLEAALAGARAARELGDLEAAAQLFSTALSVEPEHAQALAGYGEVLGELGDLAGARFALEPVLAGGGAYPARALHLVLVGRGLELAGESEAAAERYLAALREDPKLDEAHARLLAIFEAAGRVDEGIAALERWAEVAPAPDAYAARLQRAAEWELRVGGRAESAERHLRQVLEADPGPARPWEALAGLVLESGRVDEALEVATRGLASRVEQAGRGPLALIRARALEQRGEAEAAAEAWGQAAAALPRSSEAALAQARLLRGLGLWSAAADALEAFAARHPGDAAGELSEVLHQLGRLLAGPLESLDRALAVYRRAIALSPERAELRGALAELLSHRPAEWEEARAHYEILLDADPTNPRWLRGALRAAERRRSEAGVAAGLRILRALGSATPEECQAVLPAGRPPIADRFELDSPLFEKLRRVAMDCAGEIAAALRVSGAAPAPAASDAAGPSALRAASLAAEARLAAAALLPLPDARVGEVLGLVAQMALAPDQVRGDGQLVNALGQALGRRSQKRVRQLLEGESAATIERLDWGAWRSELRALAMAQALDEGRRDLRAGLALLACDAGERDPADLLEGADLTLLVATSPAATALLRLAVRGWLRAF